MTREELEQKVNEYWAADPAATWLDVMVFVYNAAVEECAEEARHEEGTTVVNLHALKVKP